MAGYLTAGWADAPFDPLAEAAASAGVEATVARVVSGGPDGEVRYTAAIGGGAVAYTAGAEESADLLLTDTYANALAMVAGEVTPNVAFMRGQTKVVGSTGILLAVLAAATGDAYDAACAKARSGR